MYLILVMILIIVYSFRVILGTLVIQEKLVPREPEAKRYLLGFQESRGPPGSQDPLEERV